MPELALCDDPARWDAFVRRSPQGSVFATTAFLAALGIACERAVWCEGGRILAAAPVFLDGDGWARTEPLPWGIYHGLMLDAARGRRRFRQVQQDAIAAAGFVEALAARYGRFAFAHSWALADLRPFLWLNAGSPPCARMDIRLRYTGILETADFAGFDDYLSTVAKSRRQQLTHARRHFAAVDTGDVDLFLDIHDRTYARHGLALSAESRTLRRCLVEGALGGGYGRLTAALDEHDAVAAVYFWLYDRQTAHHFFAANEPTQRTAHGSTFLLLHLIADTFARGLARIDFCGVDAPGHGDYKLSFNCLPTPFFETCLAPPA